METIVVYWGYIMGIMEKKMETIIVHLYIYISIVNSGKENGNHYKILGYI